VTRLEDPLKLVADLKPALLDQLAEEGYVRQREGDLALAAAESHGSRAGRQRPFRMGTGRPRRHLLAGGIAVTAAAAAAAALVVVGPSASGPGRSPASAVPGGATGARSFLLTSAQIAAHASATTGTYWYTKERAVEPTASVTKARFPGVTYAATEESWSGQDHARTIIDENVVFRFASAADKAKWEAAGKPPLATADGTSTRPSVSNYDMTVYFSYGKSRLTLKGVEELPTTAAGLEKQLRRMWDSEADKSAATGLSDPTYGDYLTQWAGELFSGPASPGTRAAMFQLLAQQPGIRIVKRVTDPLGRVGVAVGDGAGDYMIIDPQTAQELAWTSGPVHADGTMAMTSGVTVVEAMGWTNRIGVPPQS
jgi:hypothetical protein